MKTIILAAITAASVSGTAYAAPANTPNITAVMRAAHASAATHQADKFAAGPLLPAKPGDAFTVVLHPRDGDSTGVAPNTGFWTYKDGFLQYHLNLESLGRYVYGQDRPKGLFFGGRMTPGKAYTGTNAFGASVQVKVQNWSQDAIAIVSAPEGEVSPFHTESAARYAKMGIKDMPAMPKDTYPFGVAADGPTARALTTNVRVVVEGTMANAPGKSSLIECSASGGTPKIDAPIEVNQAACWAGANVTRVAYVNSVTGEVLKEFVKP